MKKLNGKKLHLRSAVISTFTALATAFLMFVSSCSLISGDDENLQLAKLSQLVKHSQLAETSDGKYLLKGRLSSGNGYESGRAVAVPASGSSSLIKNYKVTASCGTESVEADVKSVTSGGKTSWSYEVSLHSGTWNISASAYSSETQFDESTILFSGSTSVKVESGKLSGSSKVSLFPVKITGQSGTVGLTVNSYSGAGCCIARWVENGTAKSQKITFTSNMGIFTMTEDGTASPVNCGSYLVTFIFFDDAISMNHVYTLVQQVNVYANLKTSEFVNAGSGENFISGGGIKIDSTVVSAPSKVYFADGTNGKDTNDGSYYAPFKTVQKAVNKIQKINDGTSVYSIYLLGDVTAGSDDSDFTQTVITDSTAYCENVQLSDSSYNLGKSFVNINPSASLNLSIQSYDSTSVKKIDGNGKGRVLYLNEKTSLTLQNVQISGGTTGSCGGGILCLGTLELEEGAAVTANACNEEVFETVYGLGINVSGSNSYLTLKAGSSVTDNVKSDFQVSGGGISIQQNGHFLMESGSTVSNNEARWGGGIYLAVESCATISGGTVSSNTAEVTGGGIWNCADKDSDGSNAAKFTSLLISNNHARAGGGVYNRGTVILTSCVIQENFTTEDTDDSSGGGIDCNQGTLTLADDNTITRNETYRYGGGIAVTSENRNAALKITGNSTISENTTQLAGCEIYIKNSVVNGTATTSTVSISAGEILNQLTPEKMIYMDSGVLNISGSPKFNGDITLNDGAAVTVAGNITLTDKINITPVTYEEDAVVLKGTQALVSSNYTMFTVTPQQIEGAASAKAWLISDTGTLMSDSPRVGYLLLENGELKNPQLLESGDTAVAVLIYDKALTPSDTASQELNSFITGSTDSKINSIKRIYMALESSQGIFWAGVINGDYGACIEYNDLKASAAKTGLKGWSVVREKSGTYAEDPENWYPAYYYLLNYRRTEAVYNSQWYMPSLCELNVIHNNKAAIEKALTAAGKSAFSTDDCYWSCTNADTAAQWDMKNLNIATGESLSAMNRYSYEYKVLPLLALDENGDVVSNTADYFVDPVNGTDDTSYGTSVSKPFKTLSYAYSNASEASSVCILSNIQLAASENLEFTGNKKLTIFGNVFDSASYITIEGSNSTNTITVGSETFKFLKFAHVQKIRSNGVSSDSDRYPTTLSHCEVFECQPSSGNSGVVVSSSGSLVADYVKFEGNQTISHGGALNISGGTAVLSNSFFSGNSSGNRGGAIYVTNNGELSIKDGVSSDGTNTALFGNGVYNDATMIVSGDAYFHENDDISLSTGNTISISGILKPASSDGITAYISSTGATLNTTVLSMDISDEDLNGIPNYKKFKFNNTNYEISPEGKLTENTSALPSTKTVSQDELETYIANIAANGVSGETYTIKVTAPLDVEMLNKSGGYKLKTALVALNEKDFNVILDLSDSGLTQIPANAFGVSSATNTGSICKNLSGCILPSGLTDLGQSCFQYTGIKSMDIPATVTSLGGQEFVGCTSLTTVTADCQAVPDFTGCSSLNSVLLGNSVKKIKSFKGCSALTSITIPESVTTISMNAFSGCTSLETVIFSKTEGWKADSVDVDVTNPSYNAEVLKPESGDNREWTNSGS